MQFTPESWMNVRWFDANSGVGRCALVLVIVLVWQIIELNTFFLKHIFAIDTAHPLVVGRILLIAICGAPTIRQYYIYITDPRSTRLGTQSWVFLAICITESIICIKFGIRLFAQTQVWSIAAWIGMLVVGAVICVYLSVRFAQSGDVSHGELCIHRLQYTKEEMVDGRIRHQYLDSSHENLTSLSSEASEFRKKL